MTDEEYTSAGRKGKLDTRYFKYVNVNPKSRLVGDCSTRVLVAALGITYDQALRLQSAEAKKTDLGLTDTELVSPLLEKAGYVYHKKQWNSRMRRYMRVRELATKLSKNQVAVVALSNHWSYIRKNKITDTWDCGDRVVQDYWIKDL